MLMIEKAIFAAGCFWGVEEAFSKIKGVIETTVGYTGGHIENPTYEDVCTNTTGHTEAVQVKYDTEKVSYEALLKVFWDIHDPTQVNRQGVDVGTQYRSAIFYHNNEQKELAEKSKKELDDSGKFKKPIATEITEAKTFYKAEEYHQKYFQKNKSFSCSLN
jgi:peptide-methionine (S)-S-oxide reductase